MAWAHLLLLAASAAAAAAADALPGAQGEPEPAEEGAAVAAEPEPAAGEAEPKLWHLLSKDAQHTLAGVFERFSETRNETADNPLEDPSVNALLSGLLHDELDVRREAAEAEAAAEAARWAEERRAEDAERERLREEEHDRRQAERESQQAAHKAEIDRQHAEHEAEMQRMRAEGERHRREHEALMEAHRQKLEASKRRQAASREHHARNWDRISAMLQQVHTGLEEATGGWRDMPFWDDFFRNTSTMASWDQLGLQHLEPALLAAAVQPSHRVLVLQPGQAGLAERLAAALRQRQVEAALARSYGAEEAGSHDLVVEVGLLDAMAMAGEHGEAPRLEALRQATARLAALVRPGGTWLSVSAVPPSLRTPLLGRLAGGVFAVPLGEGQEEGAPGTGTHTITLVPSEQGAADAGGERRALRGAQVANLLLYGGAEAQVWAYRLRRAEGEAPAAAAGAAEEGVLDMIRQQRPGTRDDL